MFIVDKYHKLSGIWRENTIYSHWGFFVLCSGSKDGPLELGKLDVIEFNDSKDDSIRCVRVIKEIFAEI